MKLQKSKELAKKAKKLIPGGSQTLSKSPSQFVQGVAPGFLERGEGSHVWDVDGNEYIDYLMALGPVLLGYNEPEVTEAAKKALDLGTTFTLPHRLEVELAELLCSLIPCAEMVRFGKNGSDATSGAVRAARAYTGRKYIACCGYHGWQDWYIATTSRNKGIPEEVKNLTVAFQYNKIETLEKIFRDHPDQVACVIMEPVGLESPKHDFLNKVKEFTHKNGALLIFDEIVTGFRFALGGVQEYYNVIPDLACFGKGMANGFPISAVVGKEKYMRLFEEIFYSFTFGGEIISIAAALATIKKIQKDNVIPDIWEKGRLLQDGYNAIAAELGLNAITQCAGFPPRNTISFKTENGEDDLLKKSLFQQECIKRGVLFTGNHLICYRHSRKDIEKTLTVYRQGLEIIKGAMVDNSYEDLLEGEPLQAVFRRP